MMIMTRDITRSVKTENPGTPCLAIKSKSMSNPDSIIELQAIRLRIDLLEQAFKQTQPRDTNRIYLIWFELGTAYQAYNSIMDRVKAEKLQEVLA